MKRIYFFLTLLLLAATPAMLTSCDDDPWDDRPWYDDYYGDWYDRYDWYNKPFDYGKNDLVSMAQTLNGTWQGALVNEYTDDSGHRVQTRFNVEFTFAQYTTKSNNGSGYETDYDNDGNEQTLRFKWYIDPRTYNIYIEYASGMQYILDANGKSDTSGFFLGWDSKERKDLFNGVMEGTNNDELVFFDCERVTSGSRALGIGGTTANTATPSGLSFGKANGMKRVDNNVPMALRRR